MYTAQKPSQISNGNNKQNSLYRLIPTELANFVRGRQRHTAADALSRNDSWRNRHNQQLSSAQLHVELLSWLSIPNSPSPGQLAIISP